MPSRPSMMTSGSPNTAVVITRVSNATASSADRESDSISEADASPSNSRGLVARVGVTPGYRM